MLIRWKSKDKNSNSSSGSKKKRKGREGGKHKNIRFFFYIQQYYDCIFCMCLYFIGTADFPIILFLSRISHFWMLFSVPAYENPKLYNSSKESMEIRENKFSRMDFVVQCQREAENLEENFHSSQ